MQEIFDNLDYIEDVHLNNKKSTSTPEASFFKGIDDDVFSLAKRQYDKEEQKKINM